VDAAHLARYGSSHRRRGLLGRCPRGDRLGVAAARQREGREGDGSRNERKSREGEESADS